MIANIGHNYSYHIRSDRSPLNFFKAVVSLCESKVSVLTERSSLYAQAGHFFFFFLIKMYNTNTNYVLSVNKLFI